MKRRPGRGSIIQLAVALAGASAVACSGSAVPRPTAERAAEPPLELIESSPIETPLDQPDLREAFEVWPAMIGAARQRIDVAQFYASNAPGSRLEPVVAALEAAAARGVSIRFLVERSFEATYPDTLARLRNAKVSVQGLDLGPSGGSVLHAKYFVIDDREAFLGSQNFDWRALEHIQELGARIRDPAAIRALAALFAYDWALAAGGPPPPLPSSEPGHRASIRIVASPQHLLPPGVAWDLPALIELIDRAKHRVRVQLLTYRASDRKGEPWSELEDALRRAAARGVRVELLLSHWTKRANTITPLQQLARTTPIEIRLISIPPWSGGFIPFARVAHTKLLTVDGLTAWLGTSNWEKDYFYRSRNVGLLIADPTLAARIDRFFETGWSSPYTERLDPAATYDPPRVQ